jgi:hypothetical protein
MSSNWSATVLTLFPEMFPGPLGISLLGKALEKNLWQLDVRDIRDHGLGKHRTVDDTPSGGGPGMVMRADVAVAAVDAVERNDRPLIYLSPRGAPLTQARVRDLAAGPGAVLLCGRFEGLDQRRIDREDAFHAFAIRHLAHGEGLVDAGALAGDAHAFKGLQAFAGFVLLGFFVIGDVNHLDADLQRVAGTEVRQRLGPQGAHLLGFEGLQQVHFLRLSVRKSGN